MKMKRLSVAALLSVVGVSGIFLLNSNTTAATWGDAVVSEPAPVTSGTLRVAGIGGITWQNITTPGAPTGTILPGETVMGKQAVDLALEGDHLSATTVTKLVNGSTTPVSPPNDFSVTYRVLDGSQNNLTDSKPINSAAGIKLTPGQAGKTLDGVADIYIEVTVKSNHPSTDVVVPSGQQPSPAPTIQGFTGTYLTQVEQEAVR